MTDEEIKNLRTKLIDLECEIQNYRQVGRNEALKDAGWPPAMIKSVDDPFDYAVGLKDGTIIFFHYAEPCGKNNEWALLLLDNLHDNTNAYVQSMNYRVGVGKDRGLEVRVSEIVWAADAPFGS
jgi:hypothetical protein